MSRRLLSSLVLLAAIIRADEPPHGVRLKDLVTIEGVRSNQLVGYGLVVGLNGTGDRQQTLFSAQSLTNMLQRMGVSVSPTLITVKNTASVIVTATLPAFAQPGSTVDATVAAIGDAHPGGRQVNAHHIARNHQAGQYTVVLRGYIAHAMSSGAW